MLFWILKGNLSIRLCHSKSRPTGGPHLDSPPFKCAVSGFIHFVHLLVSTSFANNFGKCFYYLRDFVWDVECCIMGALYKYCLKLYGKDFQFTSCQLFYHTFFSCLFACYVILYNEWVTVIVAGKIIMQGGKKKLKTCLIFKSVKLLSFFGRLTASQRSQRARGVNATWGEPLLKHKLTVFHFPLIKNFSFSTVNCIINLLPCWFANLLLALLQ